MFDGVAIAIPSPTVDNALRTATEKDLRLTGVRNGSGKSWFSTPLLTTEETTNKHIDQYDLKLLRWTVDVLLDIVESLSMTYQYDSHTGFRGIR